MKILIPDFSEDKGSEIILFFKCEKGQEQSLMTEIEKTYMDFTSMNIDYRDEQLYVCVHLENSVF